MAEITKSINPEILFFVDGVQAAGKIPLDVKNTKIDMVSISGHKIHAPKGVGAIYIRKGTPLKTLKTISKVDRIFVRKCIELIYAYVCKLVGV